MNRAIRRLDILEWVMLAAAAVVALAGGWLVAWLVRGLGLPFRLTWTLASVLLFAVPGMSVLAREAGGWSRVVRRDQEPSAAPEPEEESWHGEEDGWTGETDETGTLDGRTE